MESEASNLPFNFKQKALVLVILIIIVLAIWLTWLLAQPTVEYASGDIQTTTPFSWNLSLESNNHWDRWTFGFSLMYDQTNSTLDWTMYDRTSKTLFSNMSINQMVKKNDLSYQFELNPDHDYELIITSLDPERVSFEIDLYQNRFFDGGLWFL